MIPCSRMLINTILLECHDNIYSGPLSEDKTMERIKTFAWCSSWRKDVIEYCHSFDSCQKANKATGKRFGLMIHIQEPSTPWEVAHMDCVTALPPRGDKGYNACLIIVDRYRKTPIFLTCHKDDTAMDTALLIWNRVISHTGLFENIISDKDPKCTSAYELIYIIFWVQNYNSQQHTIHKQMTLELSYKTSIHASTGKTPAMLEKGWNPKLPVYTLKKDLVDIHPAASSFKLLLDEVRHHANKSMNNEFQYAEQKWDKCNKTQELKVGDLILISTLSFNNIKGPKKLKDSFAGTFVIKALHGTNEVQVELSGGLKNKH
ncbi:hypothetical protein O181_119681 [Austropuccinia psidii MF-1]|uniref:Integrase zinc-binding domain-containing protein n=1 Tax=Austropuccinia psidii MF-1 TaxID=1389203 RepID=A0A9Q3PZW3_9BASI|nr:hypothetical protein [Austropuccinia psidii MF-1]